MTFSFQPTKPADQSPLPTAITQVSVIQTFVWGALYLMLGLLNLTALRAKAFLDGKHPKIYLGLDDGPKRGTGSALDTLNNNGIKVMNRR